MVQEKGRRPLYTFYLQALMYMDNVRIKVRYLYALYPRSSYHDVTTTLSWYKIYKIKKENSSVCISICIILTKVVRYNLSAPCLTHPTLFAMTLISLPVWKFFPSKMLFLTKGICLYVFWERVNNCKVFKYYQIRQTEWYILSCSNLLHYTLVLGSENWRQNGFISFGQFADRCKSTILFNYSKQMLLELFIKKSKGIAWGRNLAKRIVTFKNC